MFNEIHEECGVFGIYEEKTADVALSTYFGLYALQHRGQESCGIAVNDDGVWLLYTSPSPRDGRLCRMPSSC